MVRWLCTQELCDHALPQGVTIGMQVRGCRPAEAPVLQQLAHASNNAERALWLDAVHLFVCLHQTYHSDPPAVPVSSSATMYRRQLYVRGAVTVAQNHPSTAEHMLRILKQVNRPNFAFVMDTGQVPMPLPLLLPLPTPCPFRDHSILDRDDLFATHWWHN